MVKRIAVLFDVISNKDNSLRFKKIGILREGTMIAEEDLPILRKKAGIDIKLLASFDSKIKLSDFLEKYPGGYLRGEDYWWSEGEEVKNAPLETLTLHYPKNYEALPLAFVDYFSNLKD